MTDGSILQDSGTSLIIRFKPDISAPTFKIQSVSKQKTLILAFEEITDVETAEKFLGSQIYIHKALVPTLPGGEFYNFQILGLKPVHEGTLISGYTVIKILENPVHPILEFSNGENTVLIPFIEKYIGSISLKEGKIEVKEWQVWLDAL